jgi:hypothetical protein
MKVVENTTENGSVASHQTDQSSGCPVCGSPIQHVERDPFGVTVDCEADSDEHCGDVSPVLDADGDVVAMCWECRKKFDYQCVIGDDPDVTMCDGGHDVEVTRDSDSVPVSTEAHIYAYVRDGATAVVWAFNVTVDTETQVAEAHVHKGSDRTHGVTYGDISEAESLDEFARLWAVRRADAGLQCARETFGFLDDDAETDAEREEVIA